MRRLIIPQVVETTVRPAARLCLDCSHGDGPSNPGHRLTFRRLPLPQSKGERSMDLFSRLLKERVMFVGDVRLSSLLTG